MEIRRSNLNDVHEIMRIFTSARQYMVANGNKDQWANGYPGEQIVTTDVCSGNGYVVISDGRIVGTFTFIVGEEPTYGIIKNGAWNYDRPYGTIHRVASDGTVKGIAKLCFDYCFAKMNYIRIDTHKNNIAMQTAIERYGFKKCGNIFVGDGSERIAYDCLKNS